jgi:hypothetical protein
MPILRFIPCLPILLGLGAPAMHAKDFQSPLRVGKGTVVALEQSDKLVSKNKRYSLSVNSLGQALIKDATEKRVIWASSTGSDQPRPCILELQGNGHIVLYLLDGNKNKDGGLWASNAYRETTDGARFELDDNGVLKAFAMDGGEQPILPELWKSPAP